ncbi:MAG: site-specific integrase [Candidatus Brocadiales bacterium]|nr:site-specific integrase [Candidatus Brocadiales bacterium]
MGRIFKRGARWYVDFIVEGRRTRKTVAGDRQVALQVLKELEGRAVRGEYGLRDNQYPLVDLKDAFLKHKRLTLKSRTFEGYRQDAELILEKLRVSLVSDITSPLLDTYREGRLGQVSERTVNLEVQTLRQMLEYGVGCGLIGSNPIKDIKPLKVRRRRFRRILSGEEIDRLLQASKPLYRPVWYTALTTGLRKAELVNLTWSDIDWESREILIQAKEGFSTKTEEIRRIPIVDGLYEVLKDLKKRATSQYIFINHLGNPLRNNLLREFKATLKRAGLSSSGLDIHALRYSFISHLIRQGANPKVVQRLAGHKSIQITMNIYAQVLPRDEAHAINKLPYGGCLGKREVEIFTQVV